MTMNVKKQLATTAALAAVLVLAGIAESASAEVIISRSYSVVNKTTVSNAYVQKYPAIGSCLALTAGTTCTISQGAASTITIGTDLGISRGAVAASINFSSAATRTVTVGCTSPALAAGQKWQAFAVGTFKNYQVVLTEIGRAGGSRNTTSGVLSAFQASGTDVACGLN